MYGDSQDGLQIYCTINCNVYMLTLFAKPAYPKNEYLTNGTNSCRTGEVDVRIETENRDNDYRHNSILIIMIIIVTTIVLV